MLDPASRRPLELLVVTALALALVSAAGCGSERRVRKTYTGTDRSIVACAGDTFSIKLRSDHSTGFQWEVRGRYNLEVIRKVGFKYSPCSDPVAVAGYDTWTFKAVGSGKTTLGMVYSRPMTASAATRDFEVTVR